MGFKETRPCKECNKEKSTDQFRIYKEGKREIVSQICNDCFENLPKIESDDEVAKYLKDNPINRPLVRSSLLCEMANERFECSRTNGDS